MDRRILIGIGILVIVGLGVMFFYNMTGNVITGASVMSEEMKVENEYYKIDVGNELNSEVRDGESRPE